MRFCDYAALPDDRLELATGALLIARDEYPSLDFDGSSRELDTIARPLSELGLVDQALSAQIDALRERLYDELGFAGNVGDYYDPRNSFLNDVLSRRLGIPITLAVVYIEVARRLGIKAWGVGFPGHLLLRIGAEREHVIVDPFSGRMLGTLALERLATRALGRRARVERGMLTPMPVRHLIARMLMNLRGIYTERGDYPRLLVVLDRLIDLLPNVADELRDRGLLWAKLGAPDAALSDLKSYLKNLPHATDAGDVRRVIDELEQQRTSAN